MIARFVRATAAAVAILAGSAVAFAGPSPTPRPTATPRPTPTIVYKPFVEPTPTPETGWLPAPGTAAYDPNAPIAQPSAAPQPAATAEASTIDGHKSPPRRRAELTPGEKAYELTRDASYLDPVSWNVTAFKSRHELIVYYKGHMYRTYRAVFGRNRGPGTKLWEGDRRTPEGVYEIIEKHHSDRWRWFLGLNYPNDMDHYRYEQMRDAQEIPYDVGEGGHIGIHGTDIPILNSGNIDWTTGCISVDNRDIDELTRILPLGTVVIINP